MYVYNEAPRSLHVPFEHKERSRFYNLVYTTLLTHTTSLKGRHIKIVLIFNMVTLTIECDHTNEVDL